MNQWLDSNAWSLQHGFYDDIIYYYKKITKTRTKIVYFAMGLKTLYNIYD